MQATKASTLLFGIANVNGTLQNVEFATFPAVKDPGKSAK